MKTLKIKVLITVLFLATIIGIAAAVMTESRQVAGAADGREKYFTSIRIQKGDSLWAIAKSRISEEYSSVGEYVEEVCETNHIYDGEIKEGMYLVVPYYK